MKKRIAFVLWFLFTLSVVDALPNDASFSYSLLPENQVPENGIPYTGNAVQVAKETGTIRFYFMCGNGLIMNSTEGTKWGDSTLVVFPDGQTMLIDAGMPQYAGVLVGNLKKLGIEKLDFVVLSHNHTDHFGGLVAQNGIFANFKIGTFIWSGLNCDLYNAGQGASFHKAYLKYIIGSGVEERIVTKGTTLQIGDVSLEILNPSAQSIGTFRKLNTALMSEKHNSESIAMKITYRDFSALFCGDLYQDREDALVKEYGNRLEVDLLKANHHGKDSSNGSIWSKATNPRVVVAMYGYQMAGTAYGNYAQTGSYVFVEFYDGYIRVVSDGEDYCDTTRSQKRKTVLYAYYDRKAQQIYPQ
ncbi:MAG: ComEC/Rec2 family competence protein [Sphaerochaetaceae bacterium]